MDSSSQPGHPEETKLQKGSCAKRVGFSEQLHSQSEDDDCMVTYTNILQAAGEFGTFQRRLVALTFIPNILSAFFLSSRVILFKKLPHYCDTSWLLAIRPNLTRQELFSLTLPKKADGHFESCRMYSPVQWDFDSIVKYGLNDTQECQYGWIYIKLTKISLVSEFDLVCNRASEPSKAGDIFKAGLLLGSFIIGIMCDRIGRYKTILIMLLFYGVFGFGTTFVPSFIIYKTFQFGIGIAITGYVISSVTLVSEWLLISQRTHAIALAHCFFALGLLLLSALDYSIPHWRLLYLTGSAPVIFLVSYIWILPESPLWLMMSGQMEKAKFVLCTAASINKRTIPPELLKQLNVEKIPYGTMLGLLKEAPMRKITMIMGYVWFSISFSYLGLTFQIQKLQTNMYGTYIALALVELVARLSCIILVEKLGKRSSQVLMLLLGGITCLLQVFIPNEYLSIHLSLSLLSQIGMSAAITVAFIYSADLFPIAFRLSTKPNGKNSRSDTNLRWLKEIKGPWKTEVILSA
ncbi:solute carrier family 22 member 14-like isoform X2 [Macrotis lagotis]|uniref:solute carrier family 22 member 14-like isoform X2 n=1 Tax=Macrotis lagotis TaxID=92651 RepID=UPI003D68D06E